MARTSKARRPARVAVVTGAGSGIGRAVALRLAEDGAWVVVSDVSAAGAEGTAQQIERAGGRATAVTADVADPAAVEGLFEAAGALGPLVVAVNNAGITQPGPETESWSFDRIFGVNLSGVRHCLKHELRLMLAAGRGSIINIASNLALAPWAAQPFYSSSKAGVIGLTTSTARFAGGRGVRVNAICPGAFPTAMLADVDGGNATVAAFARLCPLGRVGQLDELTAAVSWLSSDAASFVNGSVVVVDGGTVAW